MFFFEKKNQKTFATWRMPTAAHRQSFKSFLLLFFKKEALQSLVSAINRTATSSPINAAVSRHLANHNGPASP